jgi:hypothetical protein
MSQRVSRMIQRPPLERLQHVRSRHQVRFGALTRRCMQSGLRRSRATSGSAAGIGLDVFLGSILSGLGGYLVLRGVIRSN